MIRDYSPRSFSARQKVQDRSPRNRGAGGPRGTGGGAGPGAFLKTTGIVVLSLAMLGLLAGLWVGWAVRNGLDEMGREREQRQELTAQNRELAGSRERLLEKERLEAAAARQGLFPPAVNQVKRP